MSYQYQRHGDWFTVTYSMVRKKVFQNLKKREERKQFPTTISIKFLSAYVARELDINRNERHWKFHRFVDFALRELAIVKNAVIEDEEVDNTTRLYLNHIYLVERLKKTTEAKAL